MTTLSNALPSLLVDCFMGGWSDMFGRKLPMFLPAVGGVLSSIVYILVVSLPSLGVEWLCLASFLSGGASDKAGTSLYGTHKPITDKVLTKVNGCWSY